MRADDGRDRIARQAQHQRVQEPPGHQRLAGAHGDRQKAGSAPSAWVTGHQVMIADRGAADGDDHVRAARQVQHRAQMRLVVAGDGQEPGLAPSASTIAFSAKMFEATIWSGRGSSPGMTSSSPVAMQRHTGRRVT
jgi:hypothetical protein